MATGSQTQGSIDRSVLFEKHTPPTSDPRSDSLWGNVKTGSKPTLVVGKVVRVGVGSYDCVVSTYGGLDIVCNIMAPCGSNTFGYAQSALPMEGQLVLCVMKSPNSRAGYVLGVLPGFDANVEKGVSTRENPTHSKRLQPDGQVGLEFTAAYKTPMLDRKYASFINANSGRYIDVLPGEYAMVNENDCGVVLSMFSASITSGMAYLKASRLDNSVRLVCRTFQEYTSKGYRHIYNDLGLITEEEKVSVYQGERLGIDKLTGEAFEKDEEKEKQGKYYLQNKVKRQTAKARIKSFVGFLGGLINKFVLRPDKNIEISSMDDEPKDNGVAQINVDGSGTVKIRSAGGISLERYDRIPVPYRRYEPWDPEGDVKIDEDPIKPFQWNEDSRLRGLQLSDAQAYEFGQTYKRFDQHEKDFYTPEEKELETPENKWDKIRNDETADLEKNDRKRCGIYEGTDGSIIIRDNWGSEIVMAGGDITISAAKDVRIVTPKTAAVLAKNVAVDAVSGVDVSADNIFAAARKNAHVRAEGVLLESSATEDNWSNPQQGSDTESRGITLKAKKSSVVMDSAKTHVHTTETVSVVTGDDENKRSGDVIISTGTFNTQGVVNMFTQSGLLQVSESGTTLFGNVLNLYSNGLSVIINKQAMAYTTRPLDKSPVPQMVKTVKELSDTWKRYEKFNPFTLDELKNRVFTFRSSEQLGTSDYVFLQSASFSNWSKVTAEEGDSSNFVSWTPIELSESLKPYNMSWPGYDKFQDKCYKHVHEVNITAGEVVDRKSLQDHVDIEEDELKKMPRT